GARPGEGARRAPLCGPADGPGWRLARLPPPVDSPPMSLFSRVLRAGEGKKLKALHSLVPDINALEPEIEALSDDALQHKTVEFRERIANAGPDDVDEALNELLIVASAAMREAAGRVIGQRHVDV